ncbi:MAG: helix-turn-helix domain-containing protein [Acidimicrobiia bacterium]
MAENPDFTIEEAAQYLDCSVAQIYRMRRAGIGPEGYRLGLRLRFKREELDRIIAKATTGARTKRYA